MFEIIKKEMISTIQNLKIDSDFKETQKKIDAMFNTLDSVKLYIPQLLEVSPVTDKYEGQKNNPNSNNGYPLIRKLKGGILEIGKGLQDIYVPESVIRKLNFNEGDILIPHKQDNSNDYYFEKIKDGHNSNNTSRGEINYCIISDQKLGNNYTASKYWSDGEQKLIKLDEETPMTFLISEADIQRFKLNPGSVVSIAYNKSNPNLNKVVWCYEEQDLPTIRPKPAGHYKDSNSFHAKERTAHITNSDNNNLWHRFESSKNRLANKNVLLIGSDFKKAEYNQVANDVNVDLTVLTGHEKESQLQAAIRNSHMVLIASGHLTHQRTELSRELCKSHNVAMRFISSSVSGMKKGLLDLVENPEVLVASTY